MNEAEARTDMFETTTVHTTRMARRMGWLLVLAALHWVGPAAAQLNCNAGIEFYPAGGIKSCQLNGHHQFTTNTGYRLVCADSKNIEQYPDGRIRSCILKQPAEFDAIACEGGSKIEFDAEGLVLSCKVP